MQSSRAIWSDEQTSLSPGCERSVFASPVTPKMCPLSQDDDGDDVGGVGKAFAMNRNRMKLKLLLIIQIKIFVHV